INDVLDFSKIEAGKMELVPDEYDLTLLIMDMVSMMRSRAVEKGLTLDVLVDETMPHVLYGDHVRIRQVILNLLTNAIKYTKEGGAVLSVNYEIKNENEIYLKVSVKDTGIGIREEDIKELFSAFKRIDEVRNRTIEGTGLGMNIVQNLLELMGSEPVVESVYGEGSTFSFSVLQKVLNWEPIGDFASTVNEVIDKEEGYQVLFTAPEAHILLVDDTEMNLMVIKGLLKKTLIQIDTASDGKQGLSMSESKEYDLLLVDHRMPVMDGVLMMKALRASTENPNREKPCIALTANAVAGAREEYLSVGFDDYLVKPVDGKRLEQVLMDYLPPEKVHEGADTGTDRSDEGDVSDEEISEGPKETDILNRFEEKGFLDVKEGIEYAGSAEMYLQVLKFFVKTIDDRSEEIRAFYEEGDWTDFTTKVHALKSSARTIGAAELSNRARALELAAKDGDLVYIREHTGEVLAFYGSYKEKLKGLE
ncbi:MAG: response regulator, partial [Lachnospiraceae bacterium]|nr:response regulator [Lachnospiraceae bacterium]